MIVYNYREKKGLALCLVCGFTSQLHTRFFFDNGILHSANIIQVFAWYFYLTLVLA